MEKTSHWAALYFVTLMTFGNYVLFNLLVAILVEGFSSEVIAIAVRSRNVLNASGGKRLDKVPLNLIYVRPLKLFLTTPRAITGVFKYKKSLLNYINAINIQYTNMYLL